MLNDVLEILYKIYGDFQYLFLDEIQNVEGWHLFVNRMLRKKMHVIITGSNAKLLSGELATHLSGRNKEISLYPFSFREFCTMMEVDTERRTTKAEAFRRAAFDEYLKQGGFPELLMIDDNRNYVSSLVDNILKRDIEQRYKIAYKAEFENLAHHLLNVSPAIVVTTDLADLFHFKSEHLPLLHSTNDPKLVKHGMYVSPPVMADNEETAEPLKETLEDEDTGMLLFNLHGASAPEMSGFYSDYGKTFDIGMLGETNARVFNTVACFGARYYGYSREESMLLSAFFDERFLLYAGSLIPVPMMELNVPQGVVVHEGSGSEHLMPIYCMEQFSGVPMGEAMMRAKLNYFNVFRHFERDDFSMATMMMFSLYGNPMLRMVRNEEVLQRAREEHVLPTLPQKGAAPLRRKETQRIMVKDDSSLSLLDQVRGLVDDNISAIHKEMQKHLYDELGLEPRWLSRIDRFSIPNGDGTYEEGYSYAYEDKSKAFNNMSWVEVDYDGNIKRVFKSK